MVMAPGSRLGSRTAASHGKGERRPRSERFWSCLRFVVLLLIATALGAWGYSLRPSAAKPIPVSEPMITVLADKQGVTATVNMTLSSDLAQRSPYRLTLTVTSVYPSQDVKFLVLFVRFPPAASGTGPLHGSQNAHYAVINSAPASSGTAAQIKPFTYTSSQPIGEKIQGAQLRVAFPDLSGEQPDLPSAQECGLATSLQSSYGAICAQVGNQPQWTPLLEAGTTTFMSSDPALGNYQYLAGDNPTLLGGNQWMWTGVNGVMTLAASVQAQDNEQNDLFYAGLLFGVAAGAGIAGITELLRPAWRKEPAGAASQPGD
jgi:hypothetical protein